MNFCSWTNTRIKIQFIIINHPRKKVNWNFFFLLLWNRTMFFIKILKNAKKQERKNYEKSYPEVILVISLILGKQQKKRKESMRNKFWMSWIKFVFFALEKETLILKNSFLLERT